MFAFQNQNHLHSLIAYICLTGLFLPLLILYFNKGYRSANRYLAAFLFFASLYLLENFYFFYGASANKVAFFTNTHAFFYLIGPCAFFYLRSLLRDNSKLNKTDLLHFALFGISFVGYIPYFFLVGTINCRLPIIYFPTIGTWLLFILTGFYRISSTNFLMCYKPIFIVLHYGFYQDITERKKTIP